MLESNAGDEQPLPPDWLPAATPPEDAPEWDIRLHRFLAAAEPSMRALEQRAEHDVTWAELLGSWWKPAAAIAAAAALLLLFDGRDTADSATEQGDLPLSVMAAEGEPSVLWQSLGIEADPVLALIALQQERR